MGHLWVTHTRAPGGEASRRRGRWRRRRHRTCVHRRARWRAPPRGTQRRTRHRRMTTVSSTSSFRRRRRRRGRLLPASLGVNRQAAGRGSTVGAGCAARRAASAPSPPHLHSTRALSAIDPCCGHELARRGSPSAARAGSGYICYRVWVHLLSGSVSQSVSYFTVPPRAHPSTGSQSGSATPSIRIQVSFTTPLTPAPASDIVR